MIPDPKNERPNAFQQCSNISKPSVRSLSSPSYQHSNLNFNHQNEASQPNTANYHAFGFKPVITNRTTPLQSMRKVVYYKAHDHPRNTTYTPDQGLNFLEQPCDAFLNSQDKQIDYFSQTKLHMRDSRLVYPKSNLSNFKSVPNGENILDDVKWSAKRSSMSFYENYNSERNLMEHGLYRELQKKDNFHLNLCPPLNPKHDNKPYMVSNKNLDYSTRHPGSNSYRNIRDYESSNAEWNHRLLSNRHFSMKSIVNPGLTNYRVMPQSHFRYKDTIKYPSIRQMASTYMKSPLEISKSMRLMGNPVNQSQHRRFESTRKFKRVKQNNSFNDSTTQKNQFISQKSIKGVPGSYVMDIERTSSFNLIDKLSVPQMSNNNIDINFSNLQYNLHYGCPNRYITSFHSIGKEDNRRIPSSQTSFPEINQNISQKIKKIEKPNNKNLLGIEKKYVIQDAENKSSLEDSDSSSNKSLENKSRSGLSIALIKNRCNSQTKFDIQLNQNRNVVNEHVVNKSSHLSKQNKSNLFQKESENVIDYNISINCGPKIQKKVEPKEIKTPLKNSKNNISIIKNTIGLFSQVKTVYDTKKDDSKTNIEKITEDQVSNTETIKDDLNKEKPVENQSERIKKILEAALIVIEGEKRKYKNLLCALICVFVIGDVDEKYLDLSSNERKVLDAIVFRKFKKKLNPK